MYIRACLPAKETQFKTIVWFKMIINVYVLLGAMCSSYGLQLPKYLSQCSMSDPNVNECFRNSANAAIPHIAKGDKRYKIIKLNPLVLPKVDLNSGGTFSMVVRDVRVKNLNSAKFVKSNITRNNWELTVSIDPVIIESRYEINGKISILPIGGSGASNVTIEKGLYSYVVDFKTVKKNGIEYYAIHKSSVKAEIGKVLYHFENLFNGNRGLSDQINRFINENWEDFLKEIYPAGMKIIRTIVDNIIDGYFSTIPKKYIFKV